MPTFRMSWCRADPSVPRRGRPCGPVSGWQRRTYIGNNGYAFGTLTLLSVAPWLAMPCPGKGAVRTMPDGLLNKAMTRRVVMKSALLAPAVATLPVALRGVAAQDPITVTMVTDTNGLGDQNFNDLA